MPDGIVLVGMPGSGKSVVGRRVAEILGRPFIDTDELIERSTGRTPADHIRADGEPAFRNLERQAVTDACAEPGAVVAAGGGAVLDPLNRWAMMEHGLRVQLDAPIETLVARLARAAPPRPLLGADIRAGLERTADERAAVYAAVDAVVEASRGPDVIAADVIAASARGSWRTLYDAQYGRHHPVGPERGRMLTGSGIDRRSLEEALQPFAGHAPVVIADRRALDASPSLTRALPERRMCPMDGGEAAKSFGQLERLLTWLTDLGAERLDPLIVVGGGTIGDVGALAAALHRRGMPLVQLPTTWLAQADSAIGGKVAIDLPKGKNAVGAVWPAWLIVSDIGLLATLPESQRRDGLAECLKSGLIGDAELWQLVEERGGAALATDDPAATYAMTERAARLKLAIVERDPYENGERRALNLGHTIGHALEVESGYELAHGEAVALGLRAVASIATNRGAEPGLAERIDDLLASLGFPLKRRFNRAAVVDALAGDKKRERGVLRWILPMAVGRVEEVSDVTSKEVTAALTAISA
jgi:shikimate kinase / 3-dehydroquinate synthase